MKKARSPLKEGALLNQLERPYRPIVNLLRKEHQNDHKRNANSIKKVLKELTCLKKELKQIKLNNHKQPQQTSLDMSQCRKKQAESKKADSPTQHRLGSRSSSKGNSRSNSNKREISTQTKHKTQNQVNEFSFSVDNHSKKKLQKESEQQDDNNIYQNFSMSRNGSTKRIHHKPSVQNLLSQSDRVAAIEANELYQRHANNLRNHMDIIQICGPFFSTQERMRLNIELERLSKQASRIPPHHLKTELYYQSMDLYVRNIGNQLNNLAIILNRCDRNSDNDKNKENLRSREQQLKNEKTENDIEMKVVTICKNCEENDKKDLQRSYKKELRKLEKQRSKHELQLEYKIDQLNRLSLANSNLTASNEKMIQQLQKQERKFLENQGKNQLLSQQIGHLEQLVKQLEQQKAKQIGKAKLIEEDMRYYKLEVQKIRGNHGDLRLSRQSDNRVLFDQRIKELQTLVRELKQKQALYQSIIREKDNQLQSKLEVINNFEQSNKKKTRKNVKYQQSEDSVDSAQLYKHKIEIEERNKTIQEQIDEISALNQKITILERSNRQLTGSMQLCLAQINKLHGEIDQLEAANEKYKDKYIKNRIVNERKTKKEVQNAGRKEQTMQELHQLIQHHKMAANRQQK